MSKKLLSESQVSRWSKLANIKSDKKVLNEMYGSNPMASGAREDEMAPEGDMGAGMDMSSEEPMEMDLGADAAGAEEEMSLDDDKLMSMIKDAVKAALVDAGLTDEMEEEGGEEEEMEEEGEEEAEGEEAEEGGDALSAEPGEEEEESPLEEVEVVTNDEIINETLKRVLKRLAK